MKNLSVAVLRLPPVHEQDPLYSRTLIGSLNSTEGVLSVEVNYLNYTVSIEYDDHKISLERIMSLIK